MVRAKYPGAYDDLSDQDLEKSVRSKYPGVYDDLPSTAAKADPKPSGASGGFGTLATIGDFVKEAVKGGAKGAASTALGLSELINKGTAAVGLSDPVKPEVWQAARQEFTTPTNTAQSLGKGAEQIGEFFIPGGAVNKAVKAVGPVTRAVTALGTRGGSQLASIAARAGAEGLAGAAVQTAQTGSTDGAKAVGLTAAGGALGAPAVGKGLSWLGQRVENALIKASKADVENGFKVANVYKHKLGGTIETTLQKADDKLKQYGQEMKAELTKAGASGSVPMVDVFSAIADAEKSLASNAARHTGQNEAIQRALQAIKSDIATQSGNQLFPGMVDLSTANQIKQGIGDLGAWQFGKADPDSAAKELVANAIYSKLRTLIESSATNPGRIKELNQAMGEIIPIRQAIIRRIPVEQRANVLNIGDLIGLSTGSVGVSILNRILKSGQAADVMVRSGEKIAGKTGVGTAVGAGVSQVIR